MKPRNCLYSCPPPRNTLAGRYRGFLTSMNPPPARASTPTMNDAVARRSWFVAMNTIPTTQMTTPTAIRIMAVVRLDDWLLDPVAELMLPPRCFTSAGSPGLKPTRFVADGRTLLRTAHPQQPGRLQAQNLTKHEWISDEI